MAASIDWLSAKVLKYKGVSLNGIASILQVRPSTFKKALHNSGIDLDDISNVPLEIFEKWGVMPPAAEQETEAEAPVSGLDLSWGKVKESLELGFSLQETAAASGCDVAGLEEAYRRDRPGAFDSIGTWAQVLRARKHIELIRIIQNKAEQGDLKAFILLSRWRYDRWPADVPKPPMMIKGL
jgi:DNA-binding transcriptional MerR regulator